jgi:hypothetical protein
MTATAEGTRGAAKARSAGTNLFGAMGWRVERGVIDPVAAVNVRDFMNRRRSRLQRRLAEWVGAPVRGVADYALHQERIGEYEQRGLPADLRHFLTGEFDLETRLDLRVLELLAGERCKRFLTSFLDSPAYYCHYPPMLRFKVKEAPTSLVPVHQDAPYNRHLMDFVVLWVPLVKIDEECGGLYVWDGSHLHGEVEHSSSGAWAHGAQADLSRYHRTHVLMDPGDILLFSPTLLHASAPHTSRRTRYSLDLRIVRSPNDTAKSYYDPQSRTVIRRD